MHDFGGTLVCGACEAGSAQLPALHEADAYRLQLVVLNVVEVLQVPDAELGERRRGAGPSSAAKSSRLVASWAERSKRSAARNPVRKRSINERLRPSMRHA